ncbi:MAG: hypothetical protein ACRDDY_00470 [Clostridium sp.]|uniref:hypothetical protein n=1 Tax=Clostridium sp. TaxID=1506 RepID=UPI003EE5B5CC
MDEKLIKFSEIKKSKKRSELFENAKIIKFIRIKNKKYLTENELEIFEIAEKLQTYGLSIREIGKFINLDSSSQKEYMIKYKEEKEKISREINNFIHMFF